MTEQEWLKSNNPVTMLESLTDQRFGTQPHYTISDRRLRQVGDACRSLGYCGTAEDQAAMPPAEDAGHMVRCVMNEPNRPHVPAVTAILRCVVGNPYQPMLLVKPEPVSGGFQWRKINGQLISIGEAGKSILISRDCISSEALSLANIAYESFDDNILLALADALIEGGLEEELRVKEEFKCGGEVQGVGNKGAGYYAYWQCLECGNKSYIAPQAKDGRCHMKKTISQLIPHPLLSHLRSDTPHYQGCWSLDLLLGKT